MKSVLPHHQNFSLFDCIFYSILFKHHFIFIISQLWLTSHPRSTEVLLDTGTPGTSREIYTEDADDGTQRGCEFGSHHRHIFFNLNPVWEFHNYNYVLF